MPTKVTKYDLWCFLILGIRNYDDFVQQYAVNCGPVGGGESGTPPMSREVFDAINAADLKEIAADQDMSANHLGGDNLVEVVDEVMAAMANGYAIATWYGEDAEALVIGYRAAELIVA